MCPRLATPTVPSATSMASSRFKHPLIPHWPPGREMEKKTEKLKKKKTERKDTEIKRDREKETKEKKKLRKKKGRRK